MKKNTIFLLTMLTAIAFGCQKKNPETSNPAAPAAKQALSSAGGCEYGDIHNSFMTYTLQNFQPDLSITKPDVAVDYIDSFLQDYLNSYSLDDSSKVIMTDALTENKNLLLPNEVEDITTGVRMINNPVTNAQSTLIELIQSLENVKAISSDEATKLADLLNFSAAAFAGKISDDSLKSYLQTLNDDVSTHDYVILGTVSCIGNASYEWWMQNPPSATPGIGQKPTAAVVAAIVARDVVGGVASGAVAAGAQYATTGKVGNWKAVAISAGAGAILASTGAIAKVASWLVSLF